MFGENLAIYCLAKKKKYSVFFCSNKERKVLSQTVHQENSSFKQIKHMTNNQQLLISLVIFLSATKLAFRSTTNLINFIQYSTIHEHSAFDQLEELVTFDTVYANYSVIQLSVILSTSFLLSRWFLLWNDTHLVLILIISS